MLVARRFLQDGFVRRDIGAQGGANAHVVAVGDRDNVLEDRFLVPAAANAAAGARFSDRDIKHRERRLVGACHGNGNFRRAA